MKKIIYFLSVLLCVNGLFAQSGQVTYNVKRDSITAPSDGRFKERLSKMTSYANSHKFKLIFNKIQSSFKYVEILNSDPTFSEVENNIARTAFTSKFNFYHNISTDIQIAQSRDNVLIETRNAKLDWIISTESKTIDKYLCFKATYREPFFSKKTNDVQYLLVEAWFAPILPYRFGPLQFHSLPGLILELHYKNTTYYATNIMLSDKEIAINFPKGRTISREEYEKKLEGSMAGVIIGKKREKEKNSQ
jgi:GLPGLI family protein